MTHAEARAKFPHVREFPMEPGAWGKPFDDAKKEAARLGMVRVKDGTRGADEGDDDFDGTIVPGLPTKAPPKLPWMADVTLYWRDRKAAQVAR